MNGKTTQQALQKAHYKGLSPLVPAPAGANSLYMLEVTGACKALLTKDLNKIMGKAFSPLKQSGLIFG